MIDNYDSFVYNLVRYFNELEEEIRVVRNDEVSLRDISEDKYSGIVISPGPKNPEEAGMSLEIIERFKGEIPILGICLGHQCIGHAFGGKIIKGSEPMHGKLSMVKHSNKGVFKNLHNPLKVTRYHSLVISKDEMPEELIVTAQSEDGCVMGVQHKEYPIYGVQFHPEAHLTEQGHELLKNFIEECRRFENEKI